MLTYQTVGFRNWRAETVSAMMCLNVVKPSVYLYLLCFSPLKTVQVKKNNLYILEYKLIPALLGFSNIKIFFRLKNVMGKISIFSQINNRVEQLCNLSLAKSSNS